MCIYIYICVCVCEKKNKNLPQQHPASEALVANIHVPLQQLQEFRFQKLKLLTCDVPGLCIESDVEALWLLHPWAQGDKNGQWIRMTWGTCDFIIFLSKLASGS